MGDFILKFDVCFHQLVFWILLVLAWNAIRFRPSYASAMAWSAIATLLGTAAYGYHIVTPGDGLTLFAVLTVAGMAACNSRLRLAAVGTPLCANGSSAAMLLASPDSARKATSSALNGRPLSTALRSDRSAIAIRLRSSFTVAFERFAISA